MKHVLSGGMVVPRVGLGYLLPTEPGRVALHQPWGDLDERSGLHLNLLDVAVIDDSGCVGPMGKALKVEERVDAEIDFSADPTAPSHVCRRTLVPERQRAEIDYPPILCQVGDATRSLVMRVPQVDQRRRGGALRLVCRQTSRRIKLERERSLGTAGEIAVIPILDDPRRQSD